MVLSMALKPTPVSLLTRKIPELILIMPTLMAMVTLMAVRSLAELIRMMKTARVQSLHPFFTLTLRMVPWIQVIRKTMEMLTVTLPLTLRELKRDQVPQRQVNLTEVTLTSLALIYPESFRILRGRIATPSQLGSSQVT